MKIGYFTDIHFHKHKPFSGADGRRRLEDTCKIFMDIMDIFEKEECGCIIFGGDWFHSRRLIDVDTFNTSRECLISCSEYLESVEYKFAVAGNHDYYDDGGNVCSLDFLGDFGFEVFVNPNRVHIEDMTLFFLPWDTPDNQIKSLEDFGLKKILPSQQIMLFTHSTPFGSSSPMGYIFEEGIDFDNHRYGNMFDKVWCGHIHKHQKLNRLYIPGPPLQLHFGERGNHCGVYTYNSINDKAKFHSLKGKYPEFIICDSFEEYKRIGDEYNYFRVTVNDIPDGNYGDRVEFVVEGKGEEKIDYKKMEVGLSKEEVIVKYAKASIGFDLSKLIDTGLDLIR